MRRLLRAPAAHLVLVAATAGLFPRPVLTQSVAPSFDCGRATTQDERAICNDDRLAEMDQAASVAFGAIPAASRKEAHGAQAEVLRARHACAGDKLCILDQQVTALQTYDGYGPKVPIPPWVGSYRLALISSSGRPLVGRLPSVVGQCTQTKIRSITDRFGGTIKEPKGDDFDQGSAVAFADGGFQVSYGYEPAIAASSVGDSVVLCLVSIPKNCPKGDDRGKFYSATNLRTKGSWLLPDAQHMCGGA